MKKFTDWVRIALGGLLVFMALNYIFGWMAMDAEEAGMTFLGALGATGYFFPFLKVVEGLVGLSLLINRYSSLGLLILAPITLNVVLFHFFLSPSTALFGALLFLGNAWLIWDRRESYRGLLS